MLFRSVSGRFAAYGLCNLAFGIQSAGTSLLWCGIIAGAAGGYFGGQYFGDKGKGVGKVIYELSYTR